MKLPQAADKSFEEESSGAKMSVKNVTLAGEAVQILILIYHFKTLQRKRFVE